MCLFEKGLDWESKIINLRKFEQHDPDYLKLNPNGVVPTLVHYDVPVTDSSRIIVYLDNIFPDPPLCPTGVSEKVRMEHWINWSDDVGYAAVYMPTWNRYSRPVAQDLSEKQLEQVLARIPTKERRDRWQTVASGGFTQEEIEQSYEKMIYTFENMEVALVDNPWLAGNYFSLADIAMIPFVERMVDMCSDLLEPIKYPKVYGWFECMKSRPSYGKAFFFKEVDA
jgi:glutathione S-transferase